jgi:hypothetical protein
MGMKRDRMKIVTVPLKNIRRLHPSLRADPRPSKEEMEWIEQNCGDKPCSEVCGRLGIVYCPLK